MRDLTTASGLPLRLNERDGTLASADPAHLALPAPQIRSLGDIRPLLAMPDPGPDDRPCYLMYRDVCLRDDASLFAARGVRYDITVTLPGKLGDELMKTAGHYHTLMPGLARTYLEIYEVLAGQALFLLQRVRDPRAPLTELKIEQAMLIGANVGDILLIPSHCGHVTINASDGPLVVSDLIARASENAYGAIRESHGAAYYVHSSGDPPRATPNPAYPAVPPLTWYPSPAAAGLALDVAPLYRTARAEPRRFSYLTQPGVTTQHT